MTRISELPLATTPLTGGELVPVVQSGVTSQVSVDNLTTGKSISVAGVSVTGTTASGSGLVLAPTLVRLNANRNKADGSSTALEAIFDSGNDALALAANTLYYFKGQYFITTAASAGCQPQIGFIFSNAQQDINYVFTYKASATPTYYPIQSTVASATNIGYFAAASISVIVQIEGWFKSNATTGGTVIPAFTQSVAGTGNTPPTAGANSWIMIQPMSSNPSATLLAGNWS